MKRPALNTNGPGVRRTSHLGGANGLSRASTRPRERPRGVRFHPGALRDDVMSPLYDPLAWPGGAEANRDLGLLDPKLAKAIVQASDEVIAGKLDSHFPVDIFQTGSGTSTNMNANEVIANRANQILGSPLGTKGPVHPNDHVNMGQSSNDVIPTAIHVAALLAIEKDLLPALRELETSLGKKAKEFDPVVKAGRTHLMDATPIRLGQEFGGDASQGSHGIRRGPDAGPAPP